ncbi:MAG: hypothetical protein M3X11_13730, partial [Acidobacteriota bacterium]|nr:hypothetical protein [Acidobacteriota bacterium]
MKKLLATLQTLITAFSLTFSAAAQQPAKQQPTPPKTATPQAEVKTPAQLPQIDRRKVPLAERPNLSLDDVNTIVGVDKRVIVMMAALNVAGYDYESGSRQIAGIRQQMRQDLKDTPPAIVRKLRDHFLAHRKGSNDAAAVAPYLSLALSLNEPPVFTIDVPMDRLPEDVREITDFALILEEFYQTTGFSKLLPKYIEACIKVAATYPQAAGLALGNVLTYLHTDPVLELRPLFTPSRSAPPKPEKKADKKSEKPGSPNLKDAKARQTEGDSQAVSPLDVPNRVRQFVIIPDLFNASNAANLRIVRDAYFLLLGPSNTPSVEAIRRGFISFVLDPLTERQIKEVAAIRVDLKKLMASRGDRLDAEYATRSAYFLITDSLVRAADARMDVLGLAARKASTEDEAIYQLSLGYDRGAVLVFHFYEQMKAFEAVGVNVRDYFTSMLKNIDFERETGRLAEYEQRIARYKQFRTEAVLAPAPPPTISNADEKMVARIMEADQMIKNRKYADAKAVLESALKEKPNNARVLFGLAEVSSKQASAMNEADPVEETL